jgi:membrane associated rhomboid family serine protease
MLHPRPSEIAIAGVYVPPALVIALAGLLAAWALARILDRTRLTRFFWNPPLTLLAIWVLMSAIIGLFVLAP